VDVTVEHITTTYESVTDLSGRRHVFSKRTDAVWLCDGGCCRELVVCLYLGRDQWSPFIRRDWVQYGIDTTSHYCPDCAKTAGRVLEIGNAGRQQAMAWRKRARPSCDHCLGSGFERGSFTRMFVDGSLPCLWCRDVAVLEC